MPQCMTSLPRPCRFTDLPSSAEWLANNPRLQSAGADAVEEEEEPRESPGEPS